MGARKKIPVKFSKTVVINAIKRSGGQFYSYVGRELGVDFRTIKRYIEMYPEAKMLFDFTQEIVNNLALDRFIEAVEDGEQWAIDRVLARIPEEGLSPNPPKDLEKDKEKDNKDLEALANLIDSLEVRKPDDA